MGVHHRVIVWHLGWLIFGLGFGIAIVKAMNPKDITLAVPVGTLVTIGILAAVAGLAASMRPASKAAKLDVLASIAAT